MIKNCIACGHPIHSQEHYEKAAFCYLVLHNSLSNIKTSQNVLQSLGLNVQLVPKTVTDKEADDSDC